MQHARGPACDKYLKDLEESCEQIWKDGRQLCEEVSITGNHCVHEVSPHQSHSSDSESSAFKRLWPIAIVASIAGRWRHAVERETSGDGTRESTEDTWHL